MSGIGTDRPPRCAAAPRCGFIVNAVLACALGSYAFDLPPGTLAAPGALASGQEETGGSPDLSALNVRLSTRAIHPPEGTVKRSVLLPGVRGARPLYGAPARSAILEDDARRRVLILSTESIDSSARAVRAYLLYDFELEPYLPALTACAHARRCAFDRTPATGGLACVAICLVEALRG